MKEHKKYLSIFAALLLAVFAIVCVFGVACKGNKEEDEPEPSPEITVDHTHDYEASWDWGTDYTTCDVTLTCTSTEGECDVPTVTGKATVTSADTTDATCEETGLKTYTATYEYDGKTYTGTETETLPALGHAWPAADSTKNVDWQWESRTDEVVSIVVTCERCGTTLLDEEVEYDTDSTSGTTDILSAEYEVDETLTYTSEYDTANDPEEHAHHYEPTAWDWSDDYSSCTVTLTCESVVGECPAGEETVTLETAITSGETTPATCEGTGEKTYKATLEYGGHSYTDTVIETIEALGHDYKVANATWEWSIDSEGKATATVTIACSRDSSHAAWTNTQTDIEVGTDGLYHASVTGPDGVTPLTDGYEVVEVQKEYHIDFSNPDTYEWIGTPATQGTDSETGETFMYLDVSAGTYETGILSFVAISGQTINKENVGALFTSSKSSTYFVIDLSGFEGSYVSIKVKMDANGSGSTRTLYVNNTGSNSSGIKSVSSSNKGDYGTLEYGQLISSGDVLYLTWDANIRIFTIDVEIVDEDPDYCHCGVPSYPETTDTEHVVWDWENRDEEEQKVNVTIYCTECGKIIVSEDTEYEVDVNDATKWCASVSEGSKTYESTFDIPVVGETAATESFMVPMTTDGETADSTTYSAGEAVVDNSIFTLTTVGSMEYSMGKKDESNGYLLPYANVKFEDMSGTEHTPDQALLSSIQVTCSKTEDNVAVAASDDDILEITVHQNATIYLYVYFTNESYNQNLSGTMYYNVNGGDKVSYTLPKRTDGIVKMEMTVSAGDVVKIGAEHATLNSSYVAQTGRLWLFGAEAVATASSEDVELETVVELDFNSGNFTIGELVAKDTGTDVELKYSDGTSTGFTAMGSGVTDKTKKTEIATQNGYTVLSFGGSATTSDNTISYTITKSGTYTVVMSYFSGADNDGRYGVVLGSGGSEFGTDVKDSEKTDKNKTVMTRSVTFDANAGDIIYIGSHNSGLYFTFIGIYIVTDASDEEESGVTTSEYFNNYEVTACNRSSGFSEYELKVMCTDETISCENKIVESKARVGMTYSCVSTATR